jgi:hypothetical protein
MEIIRSLYQKTPEPRVAGAFCAEKKPLLKFTEEAFCYAEFAFYGFGLKSISTTSALAVKFFTNC